MDETGQLYVWLVGSAMMLTTLSFEKSAQFLSNAISIPLEEDPDVWSAIHGGALGLCICAARTPSVALQPFNPSEDAPEWDQIVKFIGTYGHLLEQLLESEAFAAKHEFIDVFQRAARSLRVTVQFSITNTASAEESVRETMTESFGEARANFLTEDPGAIIVDTMTEGVWGFRPLVQ